MEDQNVKRYFIKRGIILLCLIAIAAAVYFGYQIYENSQPARVFLVDVDDEGFSHVDMLESRYRYEKYSVSKVPEKIKLPCGVIYNVNTQDISETDYKVSNTDYTWVLYSLQQAYVDYQNDYKPDHTVEESMQGCVGQGAVALMLCKCTDGENYGYSAALYYTLDYENLLYDYTFYICEDEEEYKDGTAAMEKFLEWFDGYIELVNETYDEK